MPAADVPSCIPPRLTVVLPVRNEAAHIEKVLEDLLAQEIAREWVEILVVDGQSTDDTRARVRALQTRDARIRLLDNPRRLSSAARAIGAEAARGEYVAYVDGHCRIPSRTLLADTVALFETTGADCLARPQPLEPHGGMGFRTPGIRARAIAAARHSPFGHSTSSEIFRETEGEVSPVSSGAMYRREVFEKIGPFDAAFDACEDVELNWRVDRAGLKTYTSPRLAVLYEPRGSYHALFRQMYRYGLGRARLHRKHPSAITWESLVPAGFVLGLPLLLASPFLPSPFGWILAAPYLLYAVLSLVFGAGAAAKAKAWGLWPFVVLAFPVIHGGLGIGYVWGRFAPRPQVTGEDE